MWRRKGEPKPGENRPEDQVARAFDRFALALLLLAAAAVVRAPLRIHHDAASLLTSALRWVEGRARLEDVAGMNLPLALYFYGLPASLSRALDTHPVPVFSFFTLVVLLVSAVACRGLLARRAPGPAPARALFVLVLAGLTLATLEGTELTFGQREVFFLALVLPFLLVRWRRAEGSPPGAVTAVLAGVAGAIGALLKPQLLLPVVAAELALRFCGGRPRLVKTPESLAFGATGLAYAGHFLLLPSNVLGAFGAAVAGAAGGYRAYDASFPDLLFRFPILPAILVSIAAFVAGRSNGADPSSRLSASLAGFTLGGLAVYFLQRKGFPYHLVPAVAGTALSGAALVSGHAATRLHETWRRTFPRLVQPLEAAARVSVALGLFACAAALVRLPERLVPVPKGPLEELLAESTSPREEVLAISTSVAPLYPALLRMDRRPYGRWVGPFMGIAFARAGDSREGPPRYPTRAAMDPAERNVLEALTRDLLAAPPRLVLVAANPPHQGLPRRFDLVEYLRAAGFLDEALAGFERGADRAGFAVYRRRTPRASPIDAATHSSIGGVRPG